MRNNANIGCQLNLFDLMALQVSGSYAEVQLILRAVTQLLQDAAAEPPKRIRTGLGPPFQPDIGVQVQPPYSNQSTAWLQGDGLVNNAAHDRPCTDAAEQRRRPQLWPISRRDQQWTPGRDTTHACGINERISSDERISISNSGYLTRWGRTSQSRQADRFYMSSSDSQRSRAPQQQQRRRSCEIVHPFEAHHR